MKYQFVTDAANARIFANSTNRNDQIKYNLEVSASGSRKNPVEILRYGIVKTKPRVSFPAGITDESLSMKTTDLIRIQISGAYSTIDEVFDDLDNAVMLFKAGRTSAENQFLLPMNAEPEYTSP